MDMTLGMFDDLTSEEAWTLWRMFRDGYNRNLQSAGVIRRYVKAYPGLYSQRVRILLSARTGSLAGVRSDLTSASWSLIDHLRRLESS